MEPQEAPPETPKCFAIMPFGRTGTSSERHYSQVYERIIRMPVREAGFLCQRGDEIPEFGQVPEQVITGLRTADLVIADLSGNNPNVFYELGYRHALDRPLLAIVDDPEKLPFSVRTLRTIQYSLTDVPIADECRRQIREVAETVKEDLAKRPHKADSTEASLLRLEDLITAGFTNLGQQISGRGESQPHRELGDELAILGQRIATQNESFQALGDAVSAGTALMRQTAHLGLVGVYSNRLQAIENDFFRAMQDETSGLSIVGSTIFGLKGSQSVGLHDILSLLSKKVGGTDFRLRILLTHWDYISYRQDQEMQVKYLARVVISKELLDATTKLVEFGLHPYVKFYKGSPTCFTIVCEGQKLMMVNPYPYQREAFNSWTAGFRAVAGGVYADFVDSHVDQPWESKRLTVPFDAACVDAIRERYEKDALRATEDLSSSLPDSPGSDLDGDQGNATPPTSL